MSTAMMSSTSARVATWQALMTPPAGPLAITVTGRCITAATVAMPPLHCITSSSWAYPAWRNAAASRSR